MFSHSFLTEIAVLGVLASLAGGTLILMSLLLLLKRDCHRKLAQMARDLDSTKEQYHRSLLELEARIEARLSAQPKEAAPVVAPVQPVIPVPEMPAKRRPLPELRTEVMEMNGVGLDASSIAARLSMRENEVRLLLKVHNTLRCVPQSE